MPAQISQNTLATVVFLSLLAAVSVSIIRNIGDSFPNLPSLQTQKTPSVDENIDKRIQSLFTIAAPAALLNQDAEASPFFTHHFAPIPRDTGDPSTKTQKIKINFQGIYQTVSGEQKAFLQVNGAFKAASVGDIITANLRLVKIDAKAISIRTGKSAQWRIGFQKSGTFEIPLQ